ncbi:MAG: ABC transporter permease [Pirellulaceae bacterium]
MKPLNRLLISDVKRMWRQSLAISVLLACGVATFVMAASTMQSLEKSQTQYYDSQHFGDVFVHLTRAPNDLAARLADIPGVGRVQTRVVREVILDMPDMIEPATCRLVSIGNDPATELNGVLLRRGRLPDPGARLEVIASSSFAEAHELRPGDKLDVIMAGRKARLHIVGIGMSPEFIYAVQPGLLLTDNRRFGVLWMPRRQMEAAFNMEGAFNDAVLELRPHASIENVIFHVDGLTKPWGGIGAYDRSDQESHHRVDDEMHQLRNTAWVTPSIFLLVSAFLFNIVLSRMVQHQKEQIATLRAFGYRPREIGMYYVRFVMVFVTVGSLSGCVAGYWLSRWLTDLYILFFRFPVLSYEFAEREAMLAVLIGVLAAAAGSFLAIRRATRLPPAVAMRPEPPPDSRHSLIERLGIKRFFSPVSRMILWRLDTNRRVTALSIIGMALGLAVLVLGTFMEDTIDYLIEVQFHQSQRQDVMLTFYEPCSADALHDAENLPGVIRAEPFRNVAVRLHSGPRQYRVGLMALEQDPQLFRVLDDKLKPVSLPPQGGLTVSRKLAEILDVSIGDELTVELLEGSQDRYRLPVAAVFPDYTNPGVYLNRQELHRLLQEGERLSGAFLSVDSARINDLYTQVKQIPAVAGVLDNNAAMNNYRDAIEDTTTGMRMINAIFASIIAFGVIYNCALITLAERSVDLATLRVMGFRRREVSWILLGELAIITLVAIPVGLPIGYLFAWFATLALDTETHRFPLVVQRATFAYATTVILLAALVSALYVRRKLDRLDLIAVLKVKE